MKITKEYLGKRLLIKKSTAYYIEPTEASLLEVSPSGDYLKLEFVRSDNTTYTDWVNVHNYQLVEDLGYRVYKGYKKQSDSATVTKEQYEKEANEALVKELKKNKWVQGICNPPSPDWKATNSQKEYVECCKSTGKRYNSVKDLVGDLSDIMNKL